MTDEITNDIGVAKYEFHPLADLFPLVEGAAFDELVADIEEHGLADKIVLHEGKILDGRNRYRAMVQLGFDDHVVRRHSEQFEKGDPLAFVISKNLKRRHLDESQRAMVAARLAILSKGANQHASIEAPSQGDAAAMFNVSRSAVQRAVVVRDHAEPELQHVVDQGKLAVSVAAEAAKLPAEQQREIAAKAEAGEANMVRAVVKKARRAQREVEPQPAKVDTNSESANSVKPPATPEQTAAERKDGYARDDAPSSPAPPASTRKTDDALALVVETDQPAAVEQPAELGTNKKPKVKPERYRDEWIDWTNAVRHLSALPACGLDVLASREPDEIEQLRQQCADALMNLNLWHRTILEKSNGRQEAADNAA